MRVLHFSFRIVIGIGLILLFTNFTKKKVYPCKKQQTPVAFNELHVDWEGTYQYDIKTGIHYGITYDDSYLFVGMKISDRNLRQKMMMSGLTFWLDTNGRGKKQMGLVFPLQHQVQASRTSVRKPDSPENKNTKMEIKKFNTRYLRGMELVDMIGFDGSRELQSGSNINESGISALLHIDSTEFLYYFASIPLELIFSVPENYLTNPDKYFSFSFEIPGVEMPQQGMGGGRQPNGGQRGGGRGMGGPGGGRPSGAGEGGPDRSQMQELMQPTKLTVKKASLVTL